MPKPRQVPRIGAAKALACLRGGVYDPVMPLPLLLEVADRPVVVVGGGAVAARKVASLLSAGARDIAVVAPSFAAHLPAAARRIAEPYRPEHLDGAWLVWAATDDPQVNDAVTRDARARGALVGRIDGRDGADFTSPAVWRGPDACVAVTLGGSPSLSAALRDRLIESIGDEWIALARVHRRLRVRLRESGRAPEQRRAALALLASAEALRAAREGETALLEWIERVEPALASLARSRAARP